MGGLKLGTAVLALAIVGLPFAATAAELPLGIHSTARSITGACAMSRGSISAIIGIAGAGGGAVPGIPGTGPRSPGSDDSRAWINHGKSQGC